jgi:hypothetical protein
MAMYKPGESLPAKTTTTTTTVNFPVKTTFPPFHCSENPTNLPKMAPQTLMKFLLLSLVLLLLDWGVAAKIMQVAAMIRQTLNG